MLSFTSTIADEADRPAESASAVLIQALPYHYELCARLIKHHGLFLLFRLFGGVLFQFHDLHRAWCAHEHFLGYAAQQEATKSAAPVRAQHDQIGIPFHGEFYDRIADMP